MSLSSLVRTDKTYRERVRRDFLLPKLQKGKPLLAEPRTKHHGLVGVAVHYLFGFYLMRLNSVFEDGGWISEAAMELLEFYLDKMKDESKNRMWLSERMKERFKIYKQAYEKGKQIIQEVRRLHRDFMRSGALSTELVRQTLRMSYIDPIFRAGAGFEYVGRDAVKEDIEDVYKQIAMIDDCLFKASEVCILGPTFGEASRLVGGADADLVLDDKLIDVKTTKKLELRFDYFCQIIGYFLLSRIGGVEGRKHDINQLGIYYSRYAYLFLFDVRDLIDDDALDELTRWFRDKIGKESRKPPGNFPENPLRRQR